MEPNSLQKNEVCDNNMQKNGFLKQFAVIGGGASINLILGLISTPIITRIVDPNEYGQLSIFTMYANIALMIMCMGLDQATVRYYYEKDNQKYKQSLLFRCIWFPVVAGLIVSIFVIVLSVLNIINFEFSTIIMMFLCIHTLDQIVYRFSQLIVRLERNVKLFSTLQILQKIAYIIFSLGLCYTIKSDYLLLLVIATSASYLVCMIVSIVAQKEMWNFRSVELNACNVSMGELLKYASPFILSMGVTTLFQAIDKISLNYFCTYTEVGIYSSTMTLVHVFAVVQTAFNTLWAPMSVEHYIKYPEDKKFHQHANQIITVVMFFFGISLILVKDVFAILLGEKYRKAAYILPFLIFNPIMYTISETTVAGLVFKKKSKLQVVVAVGACATNIIGNAILVPKWGCQGAAISTGISYIVFYLLRTLLGQKYYYVDFKLARFGIITMITSLYAFYNTFVQFSICAVLGYFVCLVALVVLYKDTIRWMIKYSVELLRQMKLKFIK